MKKKIVYISGADVFDVKDVRAAFDEVRSMLHLDSDTILFGVPVDEESALGAGTNTKTESVTDEENKITEQEYIAQDTDYEVDVSPEYNQEPIAEDIDFCDDESTDADAPTEIVVANSNEIADTEKATEDMSVVADTEDTEPAPVVPIQSVLKASAPKKTTSARKKKSAKVVQEEVSENAPEIIAQPDEISDDTPSVQEYMRDDTIIQDVAQPTESDVTEDDTTHGDIDVNDNEIENMINDDMPTEASEKTLEELLESMTPLREDVQPDVEAKDDAQNVEEIDATLESLASEFVDTQTTIQTGKKSSGRGRIGKLKNIFPLPFSSKRKDDTGLMGDLFGWAGIAANDEDFTIPGFFTNASGKK